MVDNADSWFSSRKATNQLLCVGIVVLAAGFVSIGEGYGGLQPVAGLVLIAVLASPVLLVLGWLVNPRPADVERTRDGDG
ncbi:hypothetical protein [Halopiger xanaduensis]|uniref:Uncharacterized protein n=1 Tax=Halopiger xanaduensis (strain DSM 18323 / JCM 14033 / SH-6) TaxID=797210 RepID=F8DC05_HALXS|nr:hypothetical protein [Halopiger xanaduensis]AEH35982.1 hypothetical protein Halxa_1349 [Halopiger xanaduensis SH-6]